VTRTGHFNRTIASSGMTLDSDNGPVDTVAVERVMRGFYTPLTRAENYHLDEGLTYDAELEQLVAEGLRVTASSVNRRIDRSRKRAAAQQGAAP